MESNAAEKRPKTLVILSPGFPQNETDSTCIPPQQIFVKALKDVHPDLNIVVLTFQYPFFSGEYQWHGIRVIAFGGENKGRIFRLFAMLRIWRTLIKLHKELEVIGLLSFWFGKCALIGHHFAKRYGLKHLCWILGQDAKAGNTYFTKIKPSAGSLIALSDFIAREFNKNYGVRPAHLVPVGIDSSLFSKEEVKRDIDILGVGNLIPLKQYAVFLEVISRLRLFFPEIKAAICGDGPEMKRLHDLIRTLGLENNVSLMGRLSHGEVLIQMQRSKIFLHTANYEGFGAVCLEALYAGAKVLSFVRPMDIQIPNWTIASSQENMVLRLKEFLEGSNINYQSILPYPIKANAVALVKLFTSQ